MTYLRKLRRTGTTQSLALRRMSFGTWRRQLEGRDDVPMSSGLPESALRTLGAVLRTRRLAKGLSLRELSALTSVSNAYLSELERGLHEPSLSVLLAIASALATPLVEILLQAGVLDDGEGVHESCRWDTEAAIARDPTLTEPQRFALLSVYRSFGLT